MKGKNAAKPPINKVFLCSVWKIRHGSGFENKDEKAYGKKQKKKFHMKKE